VVSPESEARDTIYNGWLESVDVARLIQDNSLVGDTEVVVSGTWTKLPKEWP